MKFINSRLALFACVLSISFGNAKATDWTDYLSPLEVNCNNDDIYISHKRDIEELPNYLLQSVSNVKTHTNKIVDDFGVTEYTLNNATYHGYEIKKIKFSTDNFHSKVVEIFFKNPNAYKILSNFKFGNANRLEKIGTKNLWVITKNGEKPKITVSKKKLEDSDFDSLFKIFDIKQIYYTDIDNGMFQTYQKTDDGELGIFGYLEFNHKTNSLSCEHGGEYN